MTDTLASDQGIPREARSALYSFEAVVVSIAYDWSQLRKASNIEDLVNITVGTSSGTTLAYHGGVGQA